MVVIKYVNPLYARSI